MADSGGVFEFSDSELMGIYLAPQLSVRQLPASSEASPVKDDGERSEGDGESGECEGEPG